jgi:hypothetical protein
MRHDPSQLEQHIGSVLLAHKIAHPTGNTDFWRRSGWGDAKSDA